MSDDVTKIFESFSLLVLEIEQVSKRVLHLTAYP